MSAPARFRAGLIYDLILRDYPRAIRCYRLALRHDPLHVVDQSFIMKRLRELQETTVEQEDVHCDIRVVRVKDASVIAHANGSGTSDDLQALAHALCQELSRVKSIRGQSLAVIGLRCRGGTRKAKIIAEELADKLTGSLASTGAFDVKERLGLKAILLEKDLDSAGIVNNKEVREQLQGVRFVIIGGVTVVPDNGDR